MSQVIESQEYSGGILKTTYKKVRVFLFNNTFTNGEVNNAEYDSITLSAGLVMGRISATGLLTPCKSTANDGSQFPVGILAADYTIQDGSSSNVFIGNSGEVNSNAISFALESDDLDTVVSGRQMRDQLQVAGLILTPVQELGL